MVVPSGFADRVGSGSAGLLNNVLRIQQVYGSQGFPAGPISIQEIRLRPYIGSRAFSATISNIQINLSTTPVAPDHLSRDFAANTGADETVVYRGALSVSSAFAGPAGGPKAFDIIIPLQVPFVYDPAAGHLLLDVRNHTGLPMANIVDYSGQSGDNASRVYAYDANAATASYTDTAADIIQVVGSPVSSAPPHIVAQPQDQIVMAGEAASFTVTATGSAPLSYQWRLNGAEISGATGATLTLANAQPADAGAYSVVITNELGAVTSAEATLTVNPAAVCAQPPAGLRGWWALDGDGQNLADGNSASLVGQPLFAAGKVLQCLDFGGVNDYVEVAASSALDVGTDDGLTIEAWINPRDLSILRPLVEWNDGRIGTHFWISVPTSTSGGIGSLFANLIDTSEESHQIVTPAGVLVTNQFQHVALTYNKGSGDAKLFLNGSVVAQTNLGSFTPLTQGDIFFGYRPHGPFSGIYYTGTMDEISIYGRALSTAEVATIYAANGIGKCKPSIPPTIVSQPQDQIVMAGEAASFTVTATGSAPLSYQWRLNGAEISGATGATLTLANAQPADAGAYSVVITNELGAVTSAEATLTVNPAAVASLYELGRDFSLVSNPNREWSYGYQSALSNALTLFTYHKIGSDERGTPVEVWSKSAYEQPMVAHNATSKTNYISGSQGMLPPGAVWFYPGPEGTPDNLGVLRFTVPPAGDGKYELKTSVQPVYVASLQGDTDFHVAKNGVELFGAELAGTQCGGYTNTLTLAAGDTIDFAVGRGADGRYYASGLQIQATLDLVSIEPTAPTIVRQPRDLTVVAGEAASFAVVANGTGPLSYQWRWNGVDLAGATGAVLALENAQAEHAGRYSVVVTNELGSATSTEAVLTVAAAPEPPLITSQPQSQTVLPGSAVSFSVVVSSTTPVTYQWEFNGGPIAGATAATLSLANVQAAQAGTYRVAVANAGGSVTSQEATLMLQAFQQPPTIIAQSGAVAVPAGTDTTLWVSAFGSEPLTYQWFFNGAALAGATSSTLTLSGLQAAQAGTYTVAIANPYGAVTNNGMLVNVVGPAGGGGTVNFVNSGANLVYDTDGVTFLARGTYYRVQLYAGLTPEALQPVGTPVNIGPISGRFLGGTRVVPTVPPGQAGWFVVKVWESAYGRSYEEARLAGGKHGASEPFEVVTANPNAVPPQIPASLLAMPGFALVPGGVLNPPEITTQPQSQSVALGASVSLSVDATGPGALRYQWFKDENLLAGATGASLNISGAAVTDSGDYVVVVNNPAGSVTSLVATLTVTVERQLFLTAPAEVNEGDLVNVPLTLVSQGEVGGLTFALSYNPDALTLPEVAWDSALEGALKLANTPVAGRLQGVFAFGAGTVPAGTQVVAVISFRARTVTALANSALALEVIDLANAAGEPLVFGTAVSGGTLAIASTGSTDNNANGAVDAGDATLLLRLLARLDTIRPWDVTRNDLNANGVLDSGDAIKLLRAAAEAEAGPVVPAGIVAERAVLSPARLRASAGQLVTLQVRLEGLTRPVVAGDFVLTYPAGAVRLAPKQAPRAGALMAANALLSFSDDGAGKLRVVISSPGAAGGGTPVVPAEGVLAEVTFEVLAGAAGQYAWGLGLGRTEAYSDGYTQRPLLPSGAVLIGRSPVAGGLGAVRRQSDGQFGFRLSGDAGADYVVEASTDLRTWAPWRTVTAGAEGLEISDSESATLPQRFYRVRPVE